MLIGLTQQKQNLADEFDRPLALPLGELAAVRLTERVPQ